MKVLEIEALLGRRILALAVIVVTFEATVVPLKVRVRSQANPFSPARETCLGEQGSFAKNHWDMRLGRGTEAMVLRFLDVEERCKEEIREGVVRELADDGESLEDAGSFSSSFWARPS